MDSLADIALSWGKAGGSSPLDAGEIVDRVSSIEDAAALVKLCKEHHSFGQHILGANVWELFDKLVSIVISSDSFSHEEVSRIVEYIFEHVRPREGYIIAAEKFISTQDFSLFSLLLVAMQTTLRRAVEIRLLRDGTQPLYRLSACY